MNWIWFHKLASPPSAYAFARTLRPWLWWPALAMMLWAAYQGLWVVPPDYQQKDAFRIIFVHVPAASMSMMVYSMMAVAAGIGLIWNMKLAHAVAAGCAVPGAVFTFLALVTGAIWGKPMWGAWWAWDPRLTTELILLFLYLGYLALRSSFDDVGRADRASAVLAIVGLVNIPIIRYSVVWWNSLHQGQTLRMFGKSSIDPSMKWPLVVMIFAFLLFFGAVLCDALCAQILRRERNASWLKNRS